MLKLDFGLLLQESVALCLTYAAVLGRRVKRNPNKKTKTNSKKLT